MTHQDISIDRLKLAIFSMESLNEAAQASFPDTAGSDKDHRPTHSCSPAHTNESLDDGAHQNKPEHRYTLLRGDASTHLRVSRSMS